MKNPYILLLFSFYLDVGHDHDHAIEWPSLKKLDVKVESMMADAASNNLDSLDSGFTELIELAKNLIETTALSFGE